MLYLCVNLCFITCRVIGGFQLIVVLLQGTPLCPVTSPCLPFLVDRVNQTVPLRHTIENLQGLPVKP